MGPFGWVYLDGSLGGFIWIGLSGLSMSLSGWVYIIGSIRVDLPMDLYGWVDLDGSI